MFRWTGGPFTIVGIADPTIAKEVLIQKSKYFDRAKEGTDNYDPIYEHNVFSSNGEEWKRYKTLLSPGFSESNLKVIFENHIHEATDELCNLWEHNIKQGKNLLNVSNYMKELALDIIGSAGFGIKLNAVKNNDMKIMTWTRKWVRALQFMALIPPSLHYYTVLGLFATMKEFYDVSKQFKELLTGIIDERKHELEKSNEEKYDLLSRMIEATDNGYNPLKNHELMGNAHVLLVAGHETTANLLQWCFYFLAKHPEVRKKVQKEINESNYDISQPLTYEEYQKGFDYVKAVMNESLRLKPPANVIGRLTKKDVNIGGYDIPQDVDVWILIRCLHEDESYWGKDVLEFRPERFLERKIDPYYFIPFGFGSRKCLGMKFAEMEATLMLIKAMKMFNCSIPKGKEDLLNEEIQEFFLQPKYDIELNFELR